MPAEDFAEYATPWIENCYLKNFNKTLVCKLIQSRIETFAEIADKLRFLSEYNDFDAELYVNQKQKADPALAKQILPAIKTKLENVAAWDNQSLFDALVELSAELECKKGAVLWIARIALTGLAATPGGASEIAEIIGREETLRRLELAAKQLG